MHWKDIYYISEKEIEKEMSVDGKCEVNAEDSPLFQIVRTIGKDAKDCVSLSYLPLDVNALINSTKARRAGAISTFLGTTREFFEEKEVVHLEYEAYTDMALQTMLEICDKVCDFVCEFLDHRT